MGEEARVVTALSESAPLTLAPVPVAPPLKVRVWLSVTPAEALNAAVPLSLFDTLGVVVDELEAVAVGRDEGDADEEALALALTCAGEALRFPLPLARPALDE